MALTKVTSGGISDIAAAVEGASDSNKFTDADHTKLNAIEASATADQTNAEIKAAVEAATDSNTFTDADHTKLNAIEASATADQTDAEIRAAVEAASDSNVFTDADHTKLNSVEASATADQTNAEIRTAVEAASDSNVFTDADHTKLNAIEASATADQTKSDIEGLGIDVPAANLTGTIADARFPAALPAIDGSSLTGITTDTTTIENNIAMLAFYRATDHSKAKYDLVDQVIDDYNDATGVDAGASTNENLSSGAYAGQTSSVGSATGGTITTSGNYKYHLFVGYDSNAHTNWNFVTPSTGTIDYLIVGAGGSGRSLHSGSIGGGSGGSSQYFSGQSKAAGTYPIVVAGPAAGWTTSTNGLYSSAFGTTKAGGTLGAITSGAGPAGTTYSAFSQFGESGVFGGGGGSQNNDGGTGGGGAGGNYNGVNADSGQNNTGGGGGSGNSGANASGDGGSGVVLVRYLTDAFTTYAVGDLTLQSTDSTASSAPSTGDLVTLIENSAGTATLNTDIKGYISRDSGANWTQGTLVDEGSWGTNKKILAFHDLDISSQPSGTSLCYKITTHNQSGSKHTKIHATSLAWA